MKLLVYTKNILHNLMPFVPVLIKNFKYSHAYRLMKYTSGQNIHQHIDKGPDTFGSCTLNLNDDYKERIHFFSKDNIRRN